MLPLRSALFLLPAALLATSCKDSGEFAPGRSPALERSMVGAGQTGAFAGELHRDERIEPVFPALYLAPREDASIALECQNWYDWISVDNKYDDWYDGDLSLAKNTRRLKQFDQEKLDSIRREYEAQGKKGKVHALLNLGCFYHEGIGVKVDYSKALEYYLAAIKTQHPGTTPDMMAKFNIRLLKAKDKNYSLETALKELAAENKQTFGNYIDCYGELLWELARNKAQTEADYALVRQTLHEMLPDDRSGSVHYVAALYHRHGQMGIAAQPQEALRLYHRAADASFPLNGYPPAQLALGHIYRFGLLGQAQNRQKARQFYALASKRNAQHEDTPATTRARLALAVDYLSCGEGTKAMEIPSPVSGGKPTRLFPSQALWEAIVNDKDPVANYNWAGLHLAYSAGVMTPSSYGPFFAAAEDCKQEDIAAAARIYWALHIKGKLNTADIELLRRIDDPAAKTLLANCYATGTGLPRNMAEAARLYAENADKCPAARHNLALCYEKGAGLAPNAAKAAALKAQAAEEFRKATPVIKL